MNLSSLIDKHNAGSEKATKDLRLNEDRKIFFFLGDGKIDKEKTLKAEEFLMATGEPAHGASFFVDSKTEAKISACPATGKPLFDNVAVLSNGETLDWKGISEQTRLIVSYTREKKDYTEDEAADLLHSLTTGSGMGASLSRLWNRSVSEWTFLEKRIKECIGTDEQKASDLALRARVVSRLVYKKPATIDSDCSDSQSLSAPRMVRVYVPKDQSWDLPVWRDGRRILVIGAKHEQKFFKLLQTHTHGYARANQLSILGDEAPVSVNKEKWLNRAIEESQAILILISPTVVMEEEETITKIMLSQTENSNRIIITVQHTNCIVPDSLVMLVPANRTQFGKVSDPDEAMVSIVAEIWKRVLHLPRLIQI